MNEPLAALADIELPDAPAWSPAIRLAILAVAMAALVIAWWLMRHRSRRPDAATPRDEARRRLDRLRADWQAGKLDDREAAYRLCALLRLGLGVPQLDSAVPPPAATADDWTAVIAELRRLRYRAAERGLDLRLFERAAAWLAPEARPHA